MIRSARLILTLAVLLQPVWTTILLAQQPDMHTFRLDMPGEPRRYGDGILRYVQSGDNLLRAGHFEKALLEYENAILQDPYQAEVYIKRAMALYRLGRFNEAERDYKYAQRLNPHAADLYGYGDPLRVLRVLAIESESELTSAADGDILTGEQLTEQDVELLVDLTAKKMRGDILEALREVNYALEQADMALKPRLLKIRGNLLVLMGYYDPAIQDYTEAIALWPDYAAAYLNRGVARLLDFNRSAACYDFEQSAGLGLDKGSDNLKFFCAF